MYIVRRNCKRQAKHQSKVERDLRSRHSANPERGYSFNPIRQIQTQIRVNHYVPAPSNCSYSSLPDLERHPSVNADRLPLTKRMENSRGWGLVKPTLTIRLSVLLDTSLVRVGVMTYYFTSTKRCIPCFSWMFWRYWSVSGIFVSYAAAWQETEMMEWFQLASHYALLLHACCDCVPLIDI